MKYLINLLPKKNAPVTEKIMYFSLNYLRYIIIITQLVVIGVFFYRFQIDQQIIDLKESVDQKKEIVQVVLPLLKEAEKIDKRSKEASKILQSQKDFLRMLKYYLSKFPETIALNTLEIKNNSISSVGLAKKITDLQSFYLTLKKDGYFEEVNLKDIKKSDMGYVFSLTLSSFH